MSLFNRLGNLFQKRSRTIGVLMESLELHQVTWTNWDMYNRLSNEGYLKNLVVFTCLNLRSSALSSIPFFAYKEGAHGKKRMLPKEHPLSKLLLRPNPSQSFKEFAEQWLLHLTIGGNAYTEIVRAGKKDVPREIYSLRPDRVKIMHNSRGISGYIYSPEFSQYSIGAGNDWMQEFAGKSLDKKSQSRVAGFDHTPLNSVSWRSNTLTGESDLIHVKYFSPLDDLYGMSPLRAIGREIDLHNAFGDWNKRFVDNNCQPAFILTSQTKVTPDRIQAIKKEIMENSTLISAGRPMLFEGGIEIQKMGHSPKDIDYIESRNSYARDIAVALGVPPILIKNEGNSTFSNKKEARVEFHESTVTDDADRFVSILDRGLVPKFNEPGLKIGYDMSMLPVSVSKRTNKWDLTMKAVDKGIISVNEGREKLNYDPIEGGDNVFMQQTRRTMDYQIEEGKQNLATDDSDDDDSNNNNKDED